MKIALLSLMILSFALSATQVLAFKSSDYNSMHRPSNLQATIDASNEGYIPCTRLLEQFDKAYKYMAITINMEGDGKVSPAQPIGSESVRSWAELKFYSEIEFNKCLGDYNVTNEAEAEAQAEKEAEEKAKKEAEEKAIAERQAEVQKAITNCDLAFFEKMTSTEKMQTFDEREACKNKTVSIPTPTSTPAPAPVVTPTIQNSPTSIPQVVSAQPANSPTEPVQNASDATSVNATGTVNTETISQEQVAQVEGVETETVTQPEEKPSVFKRVFNFLFGWLW